MRRSQMRRIQREKSCPREKVKQWTLKKMAKLFNKWKKRLHTDFILKDKTPDLDRKSVV